MIRLQMRNCNIILTNKQQKYQQYHLEKWIYLNMLQVEKVPSNQGQIIEQAKFAYPPLGKTFEK